MLLKRPQNWPVDRVCSVERVWEGKTVVCIATGPSLTAEQVETVRLAGVPTIAINDAYLMAPFADLVYFADVKWWKWHKDRPEWKAFAGERCSIYCGGQFGAYADACLLAQSSQPGLSSKPREICTGSNSGYQALNIATLAGAKRVVLLGYDGQSTNGRDHFFGSHPDKSRPPFDVIRQRFREVVPLLVAAGVDVVNASPGSVIDCFRKVTIAEGLQPAA